MLQKIVVNFIHIMYKSFYPKIEINNEIIINTFNIEFDTVYSLSDGFEYTTATKYANYGLIDQSFRPLLIGEKEYYRKKEIEMKKEELNMKIVSTNKKQFDLLGVIEEQSSMLNYHFDNLRKEKDELNKISIDEREKIENKWNKIYDNYTKLRERKINNIDIEISNLDKNNEEHILRIEKLQRAKNHIMEEINKGHCRNKHQSELMIVEDNLSSNIKTLDEENEDIIEPIVSEIEKLNEKLIDNTDKLNSLNKELELLDEE